jgi:hypothetical protein
MLLSITAFLLTVVNYFHEADAVITYSAVFPSAIHHVRGRNLAANPAMSDGLSESRIP